MKRHEVDYVQIWNDSSNKQRPQCSEKTVTAANNTTSRAAYYHARSDFQAHALKRRTAAHHARSTTTVSQHHTTTYRVHSTYHATRVGLTAQEDRPERAPAQRLYELQPDEGIAQVLRQRGAPVPAEELSEAQRTLQQVEGTTHSREHMIVDLGERSGNNSVCIVTPPNPRRFHAL
jgi:hypothetical protein